MTASNGVIIMLSYLLVVCRDEVGAYPVMKYSAKKYFRVFTNISAIYLFSKTFFHGIISS